MAKPILSVVQVTMPDAPTFEKSVFATKWYVKTYGESECREMFQERLAHYNRVNGQYIKSSGGYTDNIQEAQIFGWSRKARKKILDQYGESKFYTIVPILITPA